MGGARAQANTKLYKPGPSDHPALVIYAADESLDECSESLKALAQDIYSLKNTRQADPDRQKMADTVSDEMERGLGWTVPLSISGGKRILSTTVMVVRSHLPQHKLNQRLLPLLIHPDTAIAMIVPSRYWA